MTRRPAHRPSRRSSIVDSAIGLFSTYPPDSITVADIAAAANMTPAAVYYHFPAKEQILLEGLRAFTLSFVDQARDSLPRQADCAAMSQFICDLLVWLEERWAAAAVYFAHSSGLDLTIEALRRETRIELVTLFTRALRATKPPHFDAPQAAVVAVALLSLLETAAVCWLTQDAVFRGLGRSRFLDETAALAERIVGA